MGAVGVRDRGQPTGLRPLPGATLGAAAFDDHTQCIEPACRGFRGRGGLGGSSSPSGRRGRIAGAPDTNGEDLPGRHRVLVSELRQDAIDEGPDGGEPALAPLEVDQGEQLVGRAAVQGRPVLDALDELPCALDVAVSRRDARHRRPHPVDRVRDPVPGEDRRRQLVNAGGLTELESGIDDACAKVVGDAFVEPVPARDLERLFRRTFAISEPADGEQRHRPVTPGEHGLEVVLTHAHGFGRRIEQRRRLHRLPEVRSGVRELCHRFAPRLPIPEAIRELDGLL